MAIEEVIKAAIDSAIVLWIQNGKVCCRATNKELSPELRHALQDHKEEITAWLNQNGITSPELWQMAISLKPTPETQAVRKEESGIT